MDILYAFYASDQEQAEQQARKIQKEQGYERIDLKAYPYGFVMHRSRIAGMIEEGWGVVKQASKYQAIKWSRFVYEQEED